MDKKDWTYRKLGEVCKTSSGGTPSKSHSEYYENGNIGWLRSGDIQHRITKSNAFITQLGMDSSSAKMVFPGTVVLAMYGATVGQVGILDIATTTNQAVCSITSDTLASDFLYYLLCGKKNYFLDVAVGGAQPNISQQIIKDTIIPIPPLPIQQRIVAELDCISTILEKKRQQLKELDNLAQAIFYDMFGDPVENEKGWEVKEFGDLIKLRSGQSLSAKNIVEGEFPVYGGNGIVGYHKEFNLEGNNIVIGRVGALCGNVRNVQGKIFVTDNAFILSKEEPIENVFLTSLLVLLNLRQYARDAMQPVISNSTLRNIKVILPPLSLQQSFAAKIEAIEKQKERISQSIKEVQTLFDSRMQEYFG